MNKIILGDAIKKMKACVNDNSINMILADLPYGISKNTWDKPLDTTAMWEQFERVLKDNGVTALFSQQPFTTDLINSNRKLFRYEWIWYKTMPVGFLNARKMPLKTHENILVFYKKAPTYNPQKVPREKITTLSHKGSRSSNYGKYGEIKVKTDFYYPRDIIKFSNTAMGGDHWHPTQKPLDLLEYLIKTYTNEGDTVLDPTCGSGSVGVAAVNTNRNFIGIELLKEYYDISKFRIEAAENAQKNL